MKLFLAATSFLLFILMACDKGSQIPSVVPPPVNQDKIDGDLLVKTLQVSLNTNDTSKTIYTWDSNDRLIGLEISGKLSGSNSRGKYRIIRLPDGKLKSITAVQGFGPFVDSIVYDIHYLFFNGSSRLYYAIGTYYGTIPVSKDSIFYAYNVNEQIAMKLTYNNLNGTMKPTFKDEYIYNASGDLISYLLYAVDGFGNYYLSSTSTINYNLHKSAISFGDFGYVAYGPTVSLHSPSDGKNVSTGSSGKTYTSTYSNYLYNSFDRPYENFSSLLPQPDGFNSKYLYYYK